MLRVQTNEEKAMPVNVGTIDRVIRAVLGIVALALVFAGPLAAGGWGWERVALVVVGAILLLTSAVKFCPLYRVLGLRTCKA
jgi:ABC-type uncharacterized transport system permease subunit